MNDANGDVSRDSLDDFHDELGEYGEDYTAKSGIGKRKSTISFTSASSNDTVSALVAFYEPWSNENSAV